MLYYIYMYIFLYGWHLSDSMITLQISIVHCGKSGGGGLLKFSSRGLQEKWSSDARLKMCWSKKFFSSYMKQAEASFPQKNNVVKVLNRTMTPTQQYLNTLLQKIIIAYNLTIYDPVVSVILVQPLLESCNDNLSPNVFFLFVFKCLYKRSDCSIA